MGRRAPAASRITPTSLPGKKIRSSLRKKAFGDLNQLQQSLYSYITQGRFMMFKVNKVVTVDESAFQVPCPYHTRCRCDPCGCTGLQSAQYLKDAQALIDSTLRDDPNNALAHETMGYLKFREGRCWPRDNGMARR